jgi:predicted phosphoadenosine phosphosulfate sulfurtransferase
MIDERSALLYAQLKPYKALVAKTERFIRWALARVANPYVACSFGKDSSVMLHLVLNQKPDIPVVFASHPETRILDNYDKVIRYWIESEINYHEIFCDGGLVKVKHDQRNRMAAWSDQWDAFFIGIRSQESFGRRISLKKYGMFHRLASGKIKISPLAQWKTEDIAAYTLEHKLPLLDKYGFEGFAARTTSGIPRTHINECLQSLKNRDLNAFNAICKLFPDVNEFL